MPLNVGMATQGTPMVTVPHPGEMASTLPGYHLQQPVAIANHQVFYHPHLQQVPGQMVAQQP